MALQNALDAAAPRPAPVELESTSKSGGTGDEARRPYAVTGQGGCDEPDVVPSPTPPDAPAAMVVQALDSWSLTELVGAPRIGRLLGAVQRPSG